MQRKTILLLLALVFPVIVFIFLKMFGRNHFDIPIYHEKVSPSAGCNYQYPIPYTIADSLFTLFGWKTQQAILVSFSSMADESSMRLNEKFKPNVLQIVNVEDDLYKGSKLNLKQCIFLVPDEFNTVLVDDKKRIRGYFQLNNREETDRLIVELSILLQEY